MKPDILVLTKTYSTSLGVIRSLGAEGYHIDVFYVTGLKGVTKIVSSSKYVDHLTEFNGRKDEEIVERLTKLYEGKTEKVFLFPADDYAASLADRYSDRLSEYYILPYAGKHEQGEITRLMDKSVQSELAAKCGFPIPREWNISLREEFHIPEDMVYPCFVKLSVSAAGYKKEIGVTESREELQAECLLLKHIADDIRDPSDGERIYFCEVLESRQNENIRIVCWSYCIFLIFIQKAVFRFKHRKNICRVAPPFPITT